jgi:hypothetical protein
MQATMRLVSVERRDVNTPESIHGDIAATFANASTGESVRVRTFPEIANDLSFTKTYLVDVSEFPPDGVTAQTDQKAETVA